MSLTEDEISHLIRKCKFYNGSIKRQNYPGYWVNQPEASYEGEQMCRKLLEQKYVENPYYNGADADGIYDYRNDRSQRREYFGGNNYNIALSAIICVLIIYISYGMRK